MLVCPVAAASTIRQRSASACAVVGRRAQRSSALRSASLSMIATAGRPIRVLIALRRQPSTANTTVSQHHTRLFNALTTQDTRAQVGTLPSRIIGRRRRRICGTARPRPSPSAQFAVTFATCRVAAVRQLARMTSSLRHRPLKLHRTPSPSPSGVQRPPRFAAPASETSHGPPALFLLPSYRNPCCL